MEGTPVMTRKHRVKEAVKERLIDEVKNRVEAAVEESERRKRRGEK